MTMHSDAADFGYGVTLDFDERKGKRGLWEGRRFWNVKDRAHSSTLRVLRSVRLLLNQNFSDYVSDPQTTRLLLHEDN